MQVTMHGAHRLISHLPCKGVFNPLLYIQLYFIESRQLKKYKKVQINNRQTITT